MKKRLFSAVFACMFVFCVSAQRPFSQFSVGVDGGLPLGAGIRGAANITESLSLVAGFSYLGWDLGVDFRAYDVSGFVGGDPNNEISADINVRDPRLRIPHGRVLADWAPGGGIFSLVGGLYFGVFDLRVNAEIDNWSTLTATHGNDIMFDYFGSYLRPRTDGTIDGALRLGNAVKPYLGIGLGRVIPNNRVGFRFDIGVMYQGSPRFVSDQASVGDRGMRYFIDSEYFPEDWMFVRDFYGLIQFLPVINFSLNIRLN